MNIRAVEDGITHENIGFNYNLIGDNSTVVKIFYKSGIIRYGIILGDIHQKMYEYWQFVSYNNIEKFYETLDQSYIELVHEDAVLAIDPYLK